MSSDSHTDRRPLSASRASTVPPSLNQDQGHMHFRVQRETLHVCSMDYIMLPGQSGEAPMRTHSNSLQPNIQIFLRRGRDDQEAHRSSGQAAQTYKKTIPPSEVPGFKFLAEQLGACAERRQQGQEGWHLLKSLEARKGGLHPRPTPVRRFMPKCPWRHLQAC